MRFPLKSLSTRSVGAVIVSLFLSLFLAAAGAGCGGAEGSSTAHDPGRPAEPGAVVRRSQPPIPVAVARARVGPIASYYAATGTLEVEKEAVVVARVSGTVRSIEVEEGDFVQEGGVLLTIGNDEYLLRLRQAEANRQNLEIKHGRMEEIADQELVSKEEFEQLKSDLATAKAEEDLARLTLSYTTATAPFTGRIVRRAVDVGQNVTSSGGGGSELFVIADFEPLLARVHVPSKEFRAIRTEQAVELILDSDGQRLAGRITLVSPTIDPATGTIKVTVEIPDYPEGTRPGDFAEVQIVTERHPEAVLIAKTAVISDKGERVVYIAQDGLAERRVVEVGFTTDDHAEILSGVAPGEPVVVKGQRSLKHGYPLKVLEDDSAALAPPAAGLGS